MSPVGAWGSIVVKALLYQSDGPGIDSRWCHGIFQWLISLRPYHGPGIDSAPSENEYQKYCWGKGGRCVRLTTLPHSRVMKSGSLNLLELSGPHRARYGTPLTLPFTSLRYLTAETCSKWHWDWFPAIHSFFPFHQCSMLTFMPCYLAGQVSEYRKYSNKPMLFCKSWIM